MHLRAGAGAARPATWWINTPLMELRRDILQEATTGPVAHRAAERTQKMLPGSSSQSTPGHWPQPSTPPILRSYCRPSQKEDISSGSGGSAGSEQILVCDRNTSQNLLQLGSDRKEPGPDLHWEWTPAPLPGGEALVIFTRRGLPGRARGHLQYHRPRQSSPGQLG